MSPRRAALQTIHSECAVVPCILIASWSLPAPLTRCSSPTTAPAVDFEVDEDVTFVAVDFHVGSLLQATMRMKRELLVDPRKVRGQGELGGRGKVDQRWRC